MKLKNRMWLVDADLLTRKLTQRLSNEKPAYCWRCGGLADRVKSLFRLYESTDAKFIAFWLVRFQCACGKATVCRGNLSGEMSIEVPYLATRISQQIMGDFFYDSDRSLPFFKPFPVTISTREGSFKLAGMFTDLYGKTVSLCEGNTQDFTCPFCGSTEARTGVHFHNRKENRADIIGFVSCDSCGIGTSVRYNGDYFSEDGHRLFSALMVFLYRVYITSRLSGETMERLLVHDQTILVD